VEELGLKMGQAFSVCRELSHKEGQMRQWILSHRQAYNTCFNILTTLSLISSPRVQQGAEREAVVLSLVRSNRRGDVGCVHLCVCALVHNRFSTFSST